MPELTVENVHLKYGDNPILKGVTMTLNRGEVVSLLGPSGSGKTTLLRAVAGLEVPHEGTIRIGDKAVFDGARGARATVARASRRTFPAPATRCPAAASGTRPRALLHPAGHPARRAA